MLSAPAKPVKSADTWTQYVEVYIESARVSLSLIPFDPSSGRHPRPLSDVMREVRPRDATAARDPDPEISIQNRDSAPLPGRPTADPPLPLHSNSIAVDPMVLSLPEDLQCAANGNCATPRAPGAWDGELQ
jgi:hypothetical protein